MNLQKAKQLKKTRRQSRIRAKISGDAKTPRLCVFKSNTGLFLQLIDDSEGKTLVSVNSKEAAKKGEKTGISFEMGKLLAKKALEKNIKQAVFDRAGNKYHGRIKAAADGAREGGLEF